MGVKTAVLIGIACLVVLPSSTSGAETDNPGFLQKNVVSSELGDFAYANGRLKLTTIKKANGDIMLAVARQRRTLFRSVAADTIGELKIPSHCQWFYALDDLERLWLFVGPKEDVKADRRQTPCVVYLYGHVIDQNGKARYSIQNVTGTKDGIGVIGTQAWQGIPERFLAELHHQMPAIPQVRALLPEVSPTFTDKQISQIVVAIED